MRAALCLFLGLFLATAAPVWAGDTVMYGPAPKWVEQRDSAEIDRKRTVVLALLDVQQRIEGNTLTAYIDQAFRFSSPEALTQAGTSSAAWMPDKGDLTVHRVEILRGDSVIDVLATGARYQVLRRETGLERREIDGQLTATLAVPGLQLGDIVRVAYSRTTRDQALQDNVQIDGSLMAEPVEADLARSIVSWPEGAAVKWQVGPGAHRATETVRGGWHYLVVPLPLPKREDLPESAPSRFVRGASLEVTTFKSWEDVSRVFAPLYATPAALPADSPLAAEVAKIAAASPDPLTRAALATRLVQDKISYLLNGMSGGNYVPQPAAQTWDARFGDCKAKSLLLLTLLRGLGIEAEVVAVNAGQGDAVAVSLPMAAAFNHVIVRAQIGDQVYWLDGTASGTRLATIAETPAFRYALPIRPAGSGLIAIAPRVPQVPQIDVTMTIDQRGGIDLPALVTTRTRIGGLVGSQIGGSLPQIGAEQKKQVVDKFGEAMFKEMSSNGGLMTGGDVSFDPETGIAEFTATGIVGTQFAYRDGAMRLDIGTLLSADVSLNFDRSRPAWRDIPGELGGPSRVIAHFEVLLPPDEPGYRLGGRADYDAVYAGTTLKRSGRLEGSTLVIDEDIGTLGGELAAAEIPAEKAKALRVRNTVPYVVAPATAVRAWAYRKPQLAPRIAAVEQAYAKAIAREPKDAMTVWGRSSLRLGIRDYAGAIADLDKAIALEPDAPSYSRRGWVRVAMNQRELAVADYRKALEIAPSADTAMALASALAHVGKTDEALALLAEYDDMGDEHADIVHTRSDVLALAGKPEAGLQEIEALIEEKPADTSLLNSSCWFRARYRVGTDRMMEVCNQALERASDAAQVLDSRALAWIAQGNMANALADAEAAVKLSPGMVPAQYLRAVAGTALGQADAKAELAYFRKWFPGMVQDYARYGIAP